MSSLSTNLGIFRVQDPGIMVWSSGFRVSGVEFGGLLQSIEGLLIKFEVISGNLEQNSQPCLLSEVDTIRGMLAEGSSKRVGTIPKLPNPKLWNSNPRTLHFQPSKRPLNPYNLVDGF